MLRWSRPSHAHQLASSPGESLRRADLADRRRRVPAFLLYVLYTQRNARERTNRQSLQMVAARAAARRLSRLLRHVGPPPGEEVRLGISDASAASSSRHQRDDSAATGRPFGWPEALPPLLFDVPVPRFNASSEAEAARSYLAEQGYVVFRSVLTDSEVQHALALIWDALECLGRGINRNDARTWASVDSGRGWPWGDHGLGLISAGMEEYGFTHSDACWFVRGTPAVRDAFATVLGTDSLEVSFDGLSLFRYAHHHWSLAGSIR
jgi:hypothetical protein